MIAAALAAPSDRATAPDALAWPAPPPAAQADGDPEEGTDA